MSLLQPLPCICEDAIFEYNNARVYASAQEDSEWGSLELVLESTRPPPDHWLEYEIDTMGTTWALGVDPDDVEAFLMQEGIAPGQPYFVHLRFTVSSPDYWTGETDSSVEIERVLWVEPWSPDRIASAWEALYGRRRMLACWIPWEGP